MTTYNFFILISVYKIVILDITIVLDYANLVIKIVKIVVGLMQLTVCLAIFLN